MHPLREFAKDLLSAEVWKARLVFWAGAIVVGLVAVFFAKAADYANGLFRHLITYSPWLPLAVTPIILMLVAWLTIRFFPGSQGSGIPQAMAALEMREQALRQPLLSLRIVIGKIVLTLLGLLSGASIGREGPTVHIGASIMFSIGRLAKFPFHYMDRGLILAGSAAGIAAAFNTPLAGVVFAIEEMSRSFEERTNGTLITAVIIAGVTAVALLGNYTYFGTTDATLGAESPWPAVFICGVAGGLLGGLFSLIIVRGTRWLAPWQRRRPLLIAIGCGLVIAAAGVLSGSQTYGTGYEEARELLTQTGTLGSSYFFYKFLATVASYLSGIPGGIFAPSLATGAGLGAVIGHWLPGTPIAVVILLGMVGYFAGVVQTPITSFVIVVEMTANHELVLPLMATAFIAYVVSKLICPTAIYQELAIAFRPPQEAPKPEGEDEAKPAPASERGTP
ncbi:MAG: chloride channel protein [Gammaproteobacteria bacterium]|jgi:H+/Cl- antiporter ClcA